MEAQAEGKGPPPLSVGFTCELTAGIVDKSKSLAEIAKEEVCRPAYVSNGAAPLGTSCELWEDHDNQYCLHIWNLAALPYIIISRALSECRSVP